MPYSVRREGGSRPYKIVKTTTGEVVGTSKTREAAQASIRARHSNEQGGKNSQRSRRQK